MFRQLALLSLLLIQSGHWSTARATNLQNSEALEEYLIDKLREDPAAYATLLAAKKNLHEQYAANSREGGSAPAKGADTRGSEGIAKDVKEPKLSQTDTGGDAPPNTGGADTPPVQGGGTGGTGAATPTKNSSSHTPLPPLKHVAGEGPSGVSGHLADTNGIIFIGVIAACSVAGLVGIIMAGVCWYKLHRSAKAASEVDYPAYGVTGPTKDRLPSPGDRKLAQSAQMYHYQHQKQQMIAMEKANGEMKHDASDEESEEENEEGDYTVYECPGLAPTGEMEVKNPLFSDETPVTPGGDD